MEPLNASPRDLGQAIKGHPLRGVHMPAGFHNASGELRGQACPPALASGRMPGLCVLSSSPRVSKVPCLHAPTSPRKTAGECGDHWHPSLPARKRGSAVSAHNLSAPEGECEVAAGQGLCLWREFQLPSAPSREALRLANESLSPVV